ncbi:MAG: hypothetical protein M3Y73_12410 [Actinomycetota bacterium]|nr:hypothetical protein [Actinomycetota bacterium]
MAAIHRGRHLAEIDGDFVVFLIGARFSLLHPLRVFRDPAAKSSTARLR